MRAQGGSKNRQYYVCTGRLQHTTGCHEPAAPAQDVEAQLVAYLDSLPLPDDLQAWVYQQLDPEWDEQEVREQESRLQDRLERAVELYLAGDISKTHYEAEKAACEDKLADLRPCEIRDILAKAELLIGFAGRYEKASGSQKKKLMRGLIASAHLRKQCLESLKPQPLLYPIFRNLIKRMGFCGGSDGHSGYAQVTHRDSRARQMMLLPTVGSHCIIIFRCVQLAFDALILRLLSAPLPPTPVP